MHIMSTLISQIVFFPNIIIIERIEYGSRVESAGRVQQF